MIRTNRLSRPSEGLNGGRPGGLSQNTWNAHAENSQLPRQTHLHMEVKAGDRLHHLVSGSGGHGDPWAREPERVFADVEDEKVTIAGARQQYGVVIDDRPAAHQLGRDRRPATGRSRTGRRR